MRTKARLQQGSAVGWGFCHQLSADDAAGAAAIFDDHVGAKLRRQAARNRPRNKIDRSTGREGNHELDLIGRNGAERGREQERCGEPAFHGRTSEARVAGYSRFITMIGVSRIVNRTWPSCRRRPRFRSR
jgi:hypothetical protein